MRATLPNYLTCNQKETLRRVQHEARKAWWREGHPGWGIWDVMPEEVLHREAHSQVGHLHLLTLLAPVTQISCVCIALEKESPCRVPMASPRSSQNNGEPQGGFQSCSAAATPK